MPRKRKQQWDIGDVFAVSQKDGVCSIGQALDLMMPNVATCSFYDIRCPPDYSPAQLCLPPDRLISCLSVARWELDSGAWKVILRGQPLMVDREQWANERFRSRGWEGARIHEPSVVEDFLDAFYGLAPWDVYHDPDYLDSLLISPDKKPHNIILKKRV
jgi:hypothetical protein